MKPNKHGGKRVPGPGKRLGPKPSEFPSFAKKLRATEAERDELLSYLTGDARKDFETLIHALAFWRRAAGLPIRRSSSAKEDNKV